jgi:hypothetical protein
VKYFGALFFAFAFLATSIDAPSAQRDTVISGVGGRVSPALKLSFQRGSKASSNPAGKYDLRTSSQADNAMELTLSGSDAADSVRVNIPLEVRTNVAYDLELTLISTEGCAPPISASIESTRASGSLVSTRAIEFTRSGSPPIDLIRCVVPRPVLRGPRVSTGGNFTTPGNALLVDLNLATSPSTADRCAWRILFRLSLLPSQR